MKQNKKKLPRNEPKIEVVTTDSVAERMGHDPEENGKKVELREIYAYSSYPSDTDRCYDPDCGD